MADDRLTGDYRRDLDKPYMGHWDIPEGQDLILTISHCKKEDVKSQRGTERKTIMVFKEDVKPLILNVVNRRSITKALGTPLYEKWEGRKIALYEGREPKSEDGLAVRIRDYPPKVDTLNCEDCGEEIKAVGKYAAKVIAERAYTKYGKRLCYACAQLRKEEEEAGA